MLRSKYARAVWGCNSQGEKVLKPQSNVVNAERGRTSSRPGPSSSLQDEMLRKSRQRPASRGVRAYSRGASRSLYGGNMRRGGIFGRRIAFTLGRQHLSLCCNRDNRNKRSAVCSRKEESVVLPTTSTAVGTVYFYFVVTVGDGGRLCTGSQGMGGRIPLSRLTIVRQKIMH